MKAFFTNMNFPRAVILVSFLASLALGWMLWTSEARLTEVNRQKRGIASDIRAIQELSLRLNALQVIANEENDVTEDTSYVEYVTRTAMKPKVEIGQLDTQPSTKPLTNGLEDHILKVSPSNKNSFFPRAYIGNFLYKLEEGSNRVKVTHLKMTPKGKLRPGQIGTDEWDFDAEITVRKSTSTLQ